MADKKNTVSFDEWANGAEVKPAKTGILGRAGDLGLSALKSAISVPETAVGLANLVSGGKAGKAVESAGIRFKDAKDILDAQKSDAAKDAEWRFQNAEGFAGKLGAAVENPSLIANTLVESAAPMLAGGVVGRGLSMAAPRLAGYAGAIGEGAIGAGSAAEQIRQQTADGELTGKQAALAGATGLAATAFGALGNKIGNKLGVGDIDNALIGGAASQAPAKQAGLAKRVAGGAFSEGAPEELPQSVSEQMLQNVALDRDPMQGVDSAAAMGLVTGGAMGAGFGILNHAKAPAAAPEQATGGTQPGQTTPTGSAGPTLDAPAADQAATATLGQSLTGTPMADLIGGSGLTGGANPLQAGLSTLTSNNQMYPGMNTEPAGYTVDPETGAIIQADPVGARQMAEPVAQVEAPAPAAQAPVAPALAPPALGESLTGTPVADMLDTRTPSQRMGLNPESGGLTAAAAIAVDSGASPVTAGMGLRALSGASPAAQPVAEQSTPQQQAQPPAQQPILNNGKPFTLAEVGKANQAIGGTAVSVPGGWAIQPPATVQQPAATPATAMPTAATPAASAQSAILGRNSQPIAEGGQPFATREEAKAEKRMQPLIRVAPAEGGGFILKPASERQLAAVEKAAKRLKYPSTGETGPRSLHGFILQIGGLASGTMPDIGFDLNPRVGNRRLFSPRGKTIEQAAMAAKQEGYIQDEDENTLIEALKRSLNVSPVYTPDGYEAMAEAQMQARYEDFLAAEQDGGAENDWSRLTPEELADTGYNDYDEATQSEIRALVAQAEALGVDAESILEDVAQRTENATQKDYENAAKSAIEAAIRSSEESRSRDLGQAGAEAGPATADTQAAPAAVTGPASDVRARNLAALKARMMGQKKPTPTTPPAQTKATPAPEAGPTNQGATNGQGQETLLKAEQPTDAAAMVSGAPVAEQPSDTTKPGGFTENVRKAAGKVDAAPAQPILTSPTKADIEAQQARAEQAAKSKAAQDKADAARAAKERERKDVAAASVAAADTFELGQDAMANLTGQQDVFGAMEQEAKPVVSANTVFTEDAAAKARARLKSKLGRLNSGLDPEMMMDGITLAGYHIEKGARTFAAYARAMIEDLGDGVKPYLKSWYMGVKYDPRAASFDGMDGAAAVEAADINALTAQQETQDVPSPNTSVERNSRQPATEPAVGDVVQNGRRPDATGDNQVPGQPSGSDGGRQPDGAGVPADGPVVDGIGGDLSVHSGDAKRDAAVIATGAEFSERGSGVGNDGVSAEPVATGKVAAVAQSSSEKNRLALKQKQADSIGLKYADLDNIKATLPMLLDGQQEDVFKAETRFQKPDGYGMLFTNGTGTGKAQPLDAKLMTPTGWKLMGDIKPGDQVVGVDGKPTNVLAVYPQGEKPIFRVTFSDGATTECCDEHLWETQTLYARRKASANPDWDCAQPKVRQLSEIRSTLNEQHFIPVASPLDLSATNLAIPPYIMGAILGDGCITQNTIIIASADPEIADRVTQDLPASMSLRLREDGKRCPQYRISLDDQVRRDNGQMEQHPWLRELRALGLHGCDSATKFVPESYLIGSIQQRTELLQGMLDTDGWVDAKSKSPYFTSISRRLVDAVAFLARSLGGTATINTKRPTYHYQGERRNGQIAYNVCLNLPDGIAPFTLSRKADIYRANTKYPPRRRIVGVEMVGTKPAQCIAVDHPRHLYVTDDCIVTHNTFTGLGIIKRMARQGKTNILVVVPDEKIGDDWIGSAKLLGLNASKLADTKDAGKGIVLTTYANLGSNDALATRAWDLVVADEAHNLMKSADGTVTTYLQNLRAITMHPDGAFQRYAMLNREKIDRSKVLSDEITGLERMIAADSTTAQQRAEWDAKSEALQKELGTLRGELDKALNATRADVKANQGAKRTRLAALSATPFAYEFTIDWANGYLFDYNDGQASDETESRGYNSGSNRERFFMQHFGYSMRYNKLTKPDQTKVDTGLMQRSFNTMLKKAGSLSGRMLDVKADYDRRFVLVDSAIGNQIDEALNWIGDMAGDSVPGFSTLREVIGKKFDYLSRRYLLEAIKAKEAVPIVRKHMEMGRNVVVFHDYKKGGGFNPFNVSMGDAAGLDSATEDTKALAAAIDSFKQKFSALVNTPFQSLLSPIEVFSNEFPGVLLINGDEKKPDLLARYKAFQDDATGPQVALVQSAKNAGWSGHDTTGKHQRVLINLGQPTAPTLAIQQEGRIYRTGQVSNAIMRYMNTGTNWEKWAFATTIAGRASAAENLGMGELSRALKDSFIGAFEESDAYPPGHEGEGTGGKERDAAQNNQLTAWDRAKSLYWATQKKNSRTKAQEGVDYFATPEPVGMKMAEWLGSRGGERTLEPSAGHGAIARWLPETTKRTVIEPSNTLRSRLALVMNPSDDRILDVKFEALDAVNKFDGIAMNPPFGVGGKTAIEHLAKAATHLSDGGRIVALIPTGPAADKRFDQLMNGEQEHKVKPLGSVVVDGKETFIYKGDTIELQSGWAPPGVVIGWRQGVPLVKPTAPEFRNTAAVMVDSASIKSVKETGPRTEKYRAAKDMYTVGEVLLPSVTFERAGTAVSTRIVVLEKQSKAENAPNQKATIDLSSLSDINDLFERMENLTMPERKMTEAQKAEVEAEQKQAEASAVKTERNEAAKKQSAAVGDKVTLAGKEYDVVVYTTNAGKDIRGAWVKTKELATRFNDRTFQKKPLGWFVREKDFPRTDANQKPSVIRAKEQPLTPAATIRAAITNAYGNLLDKLEAKGLVTIAQTEREAIEAAAQARADKTGGDAEAIAGRMMSMAGLDVKYSANGNIEGFFDKQTGKSFLVADNLTAASAPGTLMHEVGIHMAAGGKLEPLFKRAGTLLKTGTQNEFIQRVKARMARAGETSDEEAAAYIVTEYENDRAKAPITIGKWLADLTAAVRAWLFSNGIILMADQLTIADIAAVARANAQSMARGGPSDGAGGQSFQRGTNAGMPENKAPGPQGDAQQGAVQGNAVAVSRQIAQAIQDDNDPYADYGLRVIPPEADVVVRPGDNLPPSNQWDDGTDTGEPLNGTSAARIDGDTEDAALKAIRLIGAHGKPGPNGYYYGDQVVLVKGEKVGAGEDVGEILLSDAVVVATWRKPDKGNSEVAPNDQSAPSDGPSGGQAFSRQDQEIRFSRAADMAGNAIDKAKQTADKAMGKDFPRAASMPDLNDDQRSLLGKVGASQSPASDAIKAATDRAGLKIRQGMVDRFAALKELDEKALGQNFIADSITNSAWVLAKMSSAGAGALNAMMKAGRIEMDAQQKVIGLKGAPNGGLTASLQKLGGPAEVERFFAWVAANRSHAIIERNKEAIAKTAEAKRELKNIIEMQAIPGKTAQQVSQLSDARKEWERIIAKHEPFLDVTERLFTDDEVAAGRTLNTGTTEEGKVRPALYSQVHAEFQQYRDDVLAIAEQTGIINSDNRAMWRDEFYVPFYRVMEDDADRGRSGGNGLSRQEAYKKLKGGKQNLNDLMENTLMNFHHLLSASLKNQAAVQAIKNAEHVGIARKVPEARRDTKTSTFVLVDGKKVFYEVDDPLVFESITTLADPSLNNTAVRVMGAFKRLFTNMTTATPQFIIANTFRDLLQASATSPTSKNIAKNLKEGIQSYRDEKTRAEMLASGGAFSFGHIYGMGADEVKASLQKTVAGAGLISSPSMIPSILRKGWDAWGNVTDLSENASRAATYVQNVEQMGKLRAAFEARDVMDFSQHGAWPAVRLLVRVVPFLNARLQGLDKLYRSGLKPSILTAMGKGTDTDKQAAARFAMVTGALTLATMALYLINADDDEYKKLEEWQKDTYWFIRIGENAFFLPKPFEVGAIATVAERTLQQAMDDKATGKLFRERMWEMLMQTFAFNPTPQMFQPLVDVYANKDAFTGRDIETAGMERMSAGLRSRDSTTAPATALSAVSRVFGDESSIAVSPVQADHLIKGYLGGVGATAAGWIDTMYRAATGQSSPDKAWSEYQPIRRFYRDLEIPVANTRYTTLFYDGLKESNRVYADVMELQKLGRTEEAEALAAEKRNPLQIRIALNAQQRRLTEINNRMKEVRRSDKDGEWKRREIDLLNTQKAMITERMGKRIEDARAQ